MIISIINDQVIVKFPLSQPKRAWKIRVTTPKRGRKLISVSTFLKNKYKIEQNDEFEWMVANPEMRDILEALKEVAPSAYREVHKAFEQVSPKVTDPAKFEKHHETTQSIGGVRIECRLRTTQRGEQPKPFPHLFVLFQLSKPSNDYYIADRRGQKIENPIGRPLYSGDKLIWKPRKGVIRAIMEGLATLSEEHKERARQEIFKVVEEI